MPGPLKVLIVDDEADACDNLHNMLTGYVDNNINIAGVAHDTTEAERLIAATMPDAVFLDIEMPDENAFAFLSRLHPYLFEVVFVTAYDTFAVRAFKLNAIDYVLKPICIEELQQAVEKLRHKIALKGAISTGGYNTDLLSQLAAREQTTKITLKGSNHIDMVDFADILFVEGLGSYSKLHYRKNNRTIEMTVSTAIYEYEELLPADLFFRVHKSYLINCAHIAEVNSSANNIVKLLGSAIEVPVSRRRIPSFIDFLKANRYKFE